MDPEIESLIGAMLYLIKLSLLFSHLMGAQWLNGRVLDSRSRVLRVQVPPAALGRVLEQDTLIAMCINDQIALMCLSVIHLQFWAYGSWDL